MATRGLRALLSRSPITQPLTLEREIVESEREREKQSGEDRRRNSDPGEMAEENSAEDWLPPGWTVEVRVRKNGKKDKVNSQSDFGTNELILCRCLIC